MHAAGFRTPPDFDATAQVTQFSPSVTPSECTAREKPRRKEFSDETKAKDAQAVELSVLTWAGYSTRLMHDDNRWGVEGTRLTLIWRKAHVAKASA